MGDNQANHPPFPLARGVSKHTTLFEDISNLVDFSHQAAQQTASANGSMNALRLFACRPRTPTRLKSLTITESLLVRTRKQYPSGRTAEGIYP
jgi:hypothetical protein